MTSTREESGIIRPSDVEAEPWVNGLGVTRVLASSAAWRLSIAEIEGSTPFSSFDGMDRMLVPLSSSGLVLDIDSVRHRLRDGEPMHFRGEDRVTGDAGRRRATVVNVMTRRSEARLHCSVLRGVETLPAEVDAAVVLGGAVPFEDGVLPAGTALLPGAARSALSMSRASLLVLRWTLTTVADSEAGERR